VTLRDVIAARLEDADDVVSGQLIVAAGGAVLEEVLDAVAARGVGVHQAALPVVAQLVAGQGTAELEPWLAGGDDRATFAIEALGRSGRADAAPLLREVVARAGATERRLALCALARIDAPGQLAWLQRRAAELVPRPSDGAEHQALLPLLDPHDLDPAREVIAVAQALAMLGDHRLGALVLELAVGPRDDFEELRVEAALALRVLTAPAMVARAATAWQRSTARTEAWLAVLGQLGCPAALRALLDLTARSPPWLAHATPWLALALDAAVAPTLDPAQRVARWYDAVARAPSHQRLRLGGPAVLADELALLDLPARRSIAVVDVACSLGVELDLISAAEARRRCARWLAPPPGALWRWGHRVALAPLG
jgi:hypothetical protein